MEAQSGSGPLFRTGPARKDEDHNEACAGIQKHSYGKLRSIAGYLPNEKALGVH